MNVSSGRTLLRRGLPDPGRLFAPAATAPGCSASGTSATTTPIAPTTAASMRRSSSPSSHVGSAPDFWNNDYFDDTYIHNGQRGSSRGTAPTSSSARRSVDGRPRGESRSSLPRDQRALTAVCPDRYRRCTNNKPNLARPCRQESRGTFVLRHDRQHRREHGPARRLPARQAAEEHDRRLPDRQRRHGRAGLFNAGIAGKIELYDGGHRVPCFVRWPAGRLGARDVGALTQVQDILPTLLDYRQRAPRGRVRWREPGPLLRGTRERRPDRMLVVQFSRMTPTRSDPEATPLRSGIGGAWSLTGVVRYGRRPGPGARSREGEARGPGEDARTIMTSGGRASSQGSRTSSRVTVGAPPEGNPCGAHQFRLGRFYADNSNHIRHCGRRAPARRTRWSINVARAGKYEITLRRWSAESRGALDAELPPYRPADSTGDPQRFPKGEALPIAEARLKIAGIDERRATKPGQEAVTFEVELPRGPTRLKTWFYDDAGTELCGAYYVYVRRIRRRLP